MSPNAPVDALVAPLRADVVSGATIIGLTAVNVMRRAVLASQAPDSEAFRTFVAELGVAILEAQPAMAPLVSLTSQLLNAFSVDDPLPTAREAVLRAAETFQHNSEGATAALAVLAGDLLPQGSTILTLSSSSSVQATLERWGKERELRIICLESRPLLEGVQLAENLAGMGLDVTVAVDAAAGRVLSDAGMVLLGADSLGDLGIMNKIGSAALVALARGQKVPIHILLDRSKLLPPVFPQPVEDARPGREIMETVPGVRVWNHYFELFAVDSVASIVTESGITSPAEIERIRSSIQVPPELRAWARTRSQ